MLDLPGEIAATPEEADAWVRGRIAGRAWCEENQEEAMSLEAIDALPHSAAAAVSGLISVTATALGAIDEQQFIYGGGFVQTLIKRLHFIGASFASCEALTPLRSPASLSGVRAASIKYSRLRAQASCALIEINAPQPLLTTGWAEQRAARKAGR